MRVLDAMLFVILSISTCSLTLFLIAEFLVFFSVDFSSIHLSSYSLVLFEDSTTSLITALLFAIHPIHSDAVSKTYFCSHFNLTH